MSCLGCCHVSRDGGRPFFQLWGSESSCPTINNRPPPPTNIPTTRLTHRPAHRTQSCVSLCRSPVAANQVANTLRPSHASHKAPSPHDPPASKLEHTIKHFKVNICVGRPDLHLQVVMDVPRVSRQERSHAWLLFLQISGGIWDAFGGDGAWYGWDLPQTNACTARRVS